MKLQEFKDWIANRTFRSTTSTVYRFISGTTLQVNDEMANSIRYEISEDEDGSFLLEHKGIVHTTITEPLRIEMNEQLNPADPISFAIHGKISNDFLGTWIEIKSDVY